MAQTYSAIKSAVQATIQDASTVNFTLAELDTFILNAMREFSTYVPFEAMETFTIESRYGQATTTSAGNLVDTTESQFVSGDVDKVVYNKTDKTWAVITSYSSTSQVALSKDIMAGSEDYRIYNKGCMDVNQINISDLTDHLGIAKVEYPKGEPRNWELMSDILSIKVDTVDNSKALTSGVQPDTEVYAWFKRRHVLSQLTDLVGAVNNSAGYSAGATTMALDALQSAGTIESGQEFTLANVRGNYRLTSDATIAANTVSVVFYPGLESTVADDTVTTFKLSTLKPQEENIIIDLAAALATISKPMKIYQHTFNAITALNLATTAITSVAARINAATTDITLGGTAAIAATVAVASASTEIALINAQIDLAASALVSGTALINTVPVAGGAPEWMNQASGDVNVGAGYFTSGRSFLDLAQADNGNAGTYINLAAAEINAGMARIREAQVNMEEANSRLSTVRSGQVMETWARNQLNDVRAKMKAMKPNKYRSGKTYTRE